MKKRLLMLPLILSAMTLSGCFAFVPGGNNDPTASITSADDKSTNGNERLSDKVINLVVGQTHTITLFKKAEDGSEYEVDNISRYIKNSLLVVEDASVASVTQTGLVTALKVGQTKFLYYVGGYNPPLECVVNVVEKEVQSISLKRYKRKSLINTTYDTNGIVINATYQTGYSEAVSPTLVDASLIDVSKVGEYDLKVFYSANGATAETTGKVKIVESESELADKVELQRSIYDLQLNNNISGLPLEGNIKTLVVPVRFKDSDSFITNYNNVKEDIGYAFNGTSEQTGFESVKTYYEKESFGKISFNNTISDWYETKFPSSYYYERDNEDELALEIRDWYFTEAHPEEDIKSYDVNGDGFFDGLYLIYGSPDYRTASLGNGASEMWMAIKGSNKNAPDVDNPVPNLFMWASYDTIYPTIARALERTGKSGFSESEYSGHDCEFELIHTHTLIHEVGHSFGLDDYYTYGDDDTLFPAEGNMQTLTIMGHDPMSLLLYNWVDPIIPNESMTIDINDFQSSHDLILLTPEWNDLNSPFDEYILLELYTPTGLNEYNAALHPLAYKGGSADTHNQIGIRIWHVDERLVLRTGKEKTDHSDFMFDPRINNVFEVADNTPKHNIDEFKDFLKLYLVRNDKDYDYRTASYMRKTDYFFEGDKFTMEDYASQFANDGKLNNNKDLNWEVNIDSIYQVDSVKNTWGATITLTKKA